MRQLLVFAKAPLPGLVKTRLASAVGAARACELYQAFLRDTAEAVAGLDGVRAEWWIEGSPSALEEILAERWHTRPQPAGDLGARLTAAVDEAFRLRGGPVVVIGTDSPLLTSERLRGVFEELGGPDDAVLLPAEDGGYVALGLSRACPEAFSEIPWSTSRACEATVRSLERAGRAVRVLEPLYDVDDRESLERLVSDLRAAPELAPRSARALLRPSFVVDATGRRVPVDPIPERIVSLVPSVTECLFDAGLGDRVVGRTDYCISPLEAVGVPAVGGPKTVDVEALFRLQPDLILANQEENDRLQVERIASKGTRVHVAYPRTLEDVAALLRDMGILLHREPPFEALAEALERVAPVPEGLRRVPCACLLWKSPYLTASADTLTSALIQAGGGENLFATPSEFRYPSVSLEDVAAVAPRVILLPSEPYEFTRDDARQIEACVPGAVALRIPGAWVTWYGSRMAEAISGLRRALDPFRFPRGEGESAAIDDSP